MILNQAGLPGIKKDGISPPHHVCTNRPEFTPSNQFIAGLRYLMLLHFQEITGKGHASKPEAS